MGLWKNRILPAHIAVFVANKNGIGRNVLSLENTNEICHVYYKILMKLLTDSLAMSTQNTLILRQK